MADPKEFKPLADLGSIALDEKNELKFYVDEFKGHRYGSIRNFMKSDGYAGPTKAGVTLNARVLAETIAALEKLPAEPAAVVEAELVRVLKKAGVELVARVILDKDGPALDLREWEAATADGKKGVRFPYKHLAAALALLKKMRPLVAKP